MIQGGWLCRAVAREAADWWLRTGRFDSAIFCSFEQKAGADRVVQLIGQALEGDSFSSHSGDDQWTTAVRLFQKLEAEGQDATLDIYEGIWHIFQQFPLPESEVSVGKSAAFINEHLR